MPTDASSREHVTAYIYRHPECFHLEGYRGEQDHSAHRWTVDTPEDFAFVEAVYADLYPANPAFTTEDVLAWQDRNPGRAVPVLAPRRVA